MGFTGWDARLDAALTPSEVVAIAGEFMAALPDIEIAQLPRSCKPRKLVLPNDVTAYAFDLLAYETSVNDGTARLISKLANFFAYASNRLARFHGPSPRMSDEEVRRFVPKPSKSEEA